MAVTQGSQENVPWGWRHWAPGANLNGSPALACATPPPYLKPELLMPPQRLLSLLTSAGVHDLMPAWHGVGEVRTKIRPIPFLPRAEDTFPSSHSTWLYPSYP